MLNLLVFSVMLRRNSILIKVLTLIFSVIIIFYFYDPSNFPDIFNKINYYFIFFSVSFLVLNQFLSSVRFKVSLSIFDVNLSLREANKINVYSIISGLVFFNFFGQSLSRSYLIGSSLGKEAAFFLTAVERAISISILLVASIFFALLCFGGISFDTSPAVMVVLAVSFVFISCGIYFSFFLSEQQTAGISHIFSKSVGGGLCWMLLITLAMHLFMLGGYLCLVLGVVGIDSISIFAVLAAILTMLGASFPISFGGWGLREVSAAFAFDAAALSPELGIAVGVGVGVLTILALGINVSVIFGQDIILRSRSSLKINGSDGRPKDSGFFLSTLAWVLPVIIFVFVMVQIPVPVGSGELMLNFADPIAIVCGMTFLFVFFQRKMWSEIWISASCGYALGALILIILLGFFLGYFKYGYLSWAFYNRLIGLGLLMSYFISGMALSSFWDRDGLHYLVKMLILALSVMLVIEYFSRIFLNPETLYAFGWDSPRWLALFGNPNAYAFFLVCCFPVVFIFLRFDASRRFDIWYYFSSAIFLLAIYLTGSRAAYGAILVVMAFLCFSYLRRVVTTVSIAIMLGVIVYLLESVLFSFGGNAGNSYLTKKLMAGGLASVQEDRILSLVEGWKMFLDFPIFGAGLGAFYHQQMNAGIPLVIHNSFLWVLAEFGIFGFVVVFGPIGIFALKNLINTSWLRDDKMYALLAIICGASIMGLAHEMMYQRILWLLLGVFLTNSLRIETRQQWSKPNI
ncbi:O-antigen ligase family protein [Thalassospira australica]|uniref:O-antigen ligase family protein n=1 Tax=Thalassospira australica TaxID=1528106 RepID=UPI00384B9B91